MNTRSTGAVVTVCREHGGDRSRLLDICRAVQGMRGCVDANAIDTIAAELGIPRVDVEGVVAFYAFLSKRPQGRVVIRLCSNVIDRLKGADRVAKGLEDELGIKFGETTPDGKFSLEWTSCMGMCDQAPAALVNGRVAPRLGPGAARRGVEILKELDDVADLDRLHLQDDGDGNNADDRVRSAVRNNLRRPGEVIFGATKTGVALDNALSMSPVEVIREIKTARLRGRGGAGFPTGMKWEFTRTAGGEERYLVCNADEGEPGTFKDRVILTERADLLFEGMAIGGYAVGASTGILYLRGEYAYLHDLLEDVLDRRRAAGLLGKNIRGRGFDFDIRVQVGAGAYICGEETALLSSCEGLSGEPRTRPPFPAQHGYRDQPTSVNNVETLCCVARILEMGSGWFAAMGTPASTGTKLLSVSGDCRRPGVYEVPFGTPLRAVFEMCGAEQPIAAQVGGPSGWMVGEDSFDRTLCFDDLATGGALMVFGPGRDVLWIASTFMDFFIHESCGRCTPCRVGNVLLKERLDRIIAGRGEPADLDYLEELGNTIKITSRCGLGQTSPHPVLSTLENFRSAYDALVNEPIDGRQPSFDLERAVTGSRTLIGQDPGQTQEPS